MNMFVKWFVYLIFGINYYVSTLIWYYDYYLEQLKDVTVVILEVGPH